MDSSGRSNTRQERLKQRLKLLEEHHLIRMAQLDDESRQLRQEYERSLEQIELHFKAKMVKVSKKRSGEDVGEIVPVEQISLSDGTLHKLIFSSSAKSDGTGPDSRCPNIQIAQPNILSHCKTGTEYENEGPHTISSPEFPDEIDEIVQSKKQSAVQLQVFCTVNVRSSLTSMVQNDQSGGVDGAHLSSESNRSRSMGQTEIVDTTNTNVVQLYSCSENEVLAEENVVGSYGLLATFDQVVCITNTPTVTQSEAIPKHSFSLTQYYSMQEHFTSNSRFAKSEPKQNIVILPSASANSKKVAVEMGSLFIDEYCFIQLLAIDRLFVVFASYDDCHPQSSTDGVEFDPGGFNTGCQRGLLLLKRWMSVNCLRYSPRFSNIFTRVVEKHTPTSWSVTNHGHLNRSPSQNTTQSAYGNRHTHDGKEVNIVFCDQITIEFDCFIGAGKLKLMLLNGKSSMSSVSISLAL
ncbi:uncharacterized protein LOC134291629 [Aedes albopictus]|uniref:Knl1 C-terminal RWD domain-containing protein n=1 Tax=Aedes albopictus TaxID=7160 RepID=A0ABM1ZF60_AEDAL